MEGTTKNVLFIINHATEEELQAVKHSFDSIQADTPLQLHLLYVKPDLPLSYFHLPSMAEMANECNTNAKNLLTNAGEKLNIQQKQQWLATGSINNEAQKLAKRLNTSFILTGNATHKKVSQKFGLGRFRKGCDVETISGLSKMCLQTHYA